MKNYNKCGVYVIRNIKNGKMYVGSTITSFSKRWQCHKKRLRENRHHSAHLQAAYNKYGKDNLEFQIVEIVSPEDVRKREAHYISLYNVLDPAYGYNTAVVNIDGSTSVAESTRLKLSNITKQMWKEGKFDNSFRKGKPS